MSEASKDAWAEMFANEATATAMVAATNATSAAVAASGVAVAEATRKVCDLVRACETPEQLKNLVDTLCPPIIKSDGDA